MKLTVVSVLLTIVAAVQGFVPTVPTNARVSSTNLLAKYNSMDEILAKFPSDKPVLINFYNANTENEIKDDIFRAKKLLADRLTLVSIKQQGEPSPEAYHRPCLLTNF